MSLSDKQWFELYLLGTTGAVVRIPIDERTLSTSLPK